jgi:hypothetical protein
MTGEMIGGVEREQERCDHSGGNRQDWQGSPAHRTTVMTDATGLREKKYDGRESEDSRPSQS